MSKQKAHDKLFQQVRDELALWNFEALAEEANISNPTLYNWYNGKVSSPHLRTVMAVAKAMGFDLQLVRQQARLRAVA